MSTNDKNGENYNFNDFVKVRLTDAGRERLAAYYADVNSQVRARNNLEPTAEELAGEFQMYQFFFIFGPNIEEHIEDMNFVLRRF